MGLKWDTSEWVRGRELAQLRRQGTGLVAIFSRSKAQNLAQVCILIAQFLWSRNPENMFYDSENWLWLVLDVTHNWSQASFFLRVLAVGCSQWPRLSHSPRILPWCMLTPMPGLCYGPLSELKYILGLLLFYVLFPFQPGCTAVHLGTPHGTCKKRKE